MDKNLNKFYENFNNIIRKLSKEEIIRPQITVNEILKVIRAHKIKVHTKSLKRGQDLCIHIVD